VVRGLESPASDYSSDDNFIRFEYETSVEVVFDGDVSRKQFRSVPGSSAMPEPASSPFAPPHPTGITIQCVMQRHILVGTFGVELRIPDEASRRFLQIDLQRFRSFPNRAWPFPTRRRLRRRQAKRGNKEAEAREESVQTHDGDFFRFPLPP